MGLSLYSVVLNTADLPRSYGFWTALLGARPRDEEFALTADVDWVTLSVPGGGHLALQVGEVRAVEKDQPIHLDLRATDRRQEIERSVALGATLQTDWPYPADADYTVLRAPDGHLFCIIDP